MEHQSLNCLLDLTVTICSTIFKVIYQNRKKGMGRDLN
jgi:hypothetical protein